MSDLILTGLGGKNPLAFLAALGVVNALADQRKGAAGVELKLAWSDDGAYHATIVDGPDRPTMLDALARDLATFHNEPAIELLRYSKPGGAEAHDLKPPPETFARYLRDLVRAGSRRSLALAGAFATDVARDNNGNTKPTALHFTAGQQEFLSTAHELVEGVRPEDFEEALFGPWRRNKETKQFNWDSTTSRDYALRASDPSKEKKLAVPGADWLAFRGLSFVGVSPVGDRIVTTGCTGGWKTGTFRWPLWTVPIPRRVIGGVLASQEVFAVEPQVLRARGIAIVFESAIRRSDQGGYGSFGPARVALPRAARRG